MLPYVYQVTQYDPADRDERGHYVGALDSDSDYGPVEAAYLQAVAAFLEDAGIRRLTIRAPEISDFIQLSLPGATDGHSLAGLFPPDLAGYHDGAGVPAAVGLELVRIMLRGSGAWCRLEVAGSFFVHVGWDQYVYVGSSAPCARAVARTRALGLFPERLDVSPYDPALDDEPGTEQPADDAFWARLRRCVATGEAALLEEGYVRNASRWHRLTPANVDAVRAGLTPRARLTVWPDLSADIAALLGAMPAEGLIEVVWEDADGQITSAVADETQFADLPAVLAGARAAAVLPVTLDDRHPLLTAALPDSDGVLRVR
jgi:small subunit ribosomal protein S1